VNLPTTRARRVVAAGAAVALGAVAALGQAPAQAAEPTETLADGLFSPLSVAVNGDDVAYFSENFAGRLLMKKPGRKVKEVFTSPKGNEVGAISTKGKKVYFVHGFKLMEINKKGAISPLASFRAYEKQHNPDGDLEYGLVDPSAECAEGWPTQGPPASYPGIVESHPYGTEAKGAAVFVADAAANAILMYQGGEVSTVAVLPQVPVEITADMAEEFQVPEACVGTTYNFESVPTDVEMGPDGLLYVTTLPGGEIPGAASVLTVDPDSGAVETVAGGFTSATNVAVDGNGDVYVTELFTNTLTKVPAGGEPEPFWQGQGAPGPAAVEIRNGVLYATINALTGQSGEPGDEPAGELVTWQLVE